MLWKLGVEGKDFLLTLWRTCIVQNCSLPILLSLQTKRKNIKGENIKIGRFCLEN